LRESFKTQFPEDAAKITSFGEDNCRFEQEDVCKKIPKMGILYLASYPTIAGDL